MADSSDTGDVSGAGVDYVRLAHRQERETLAEFGEVRTLATPRVRCPGHNCGPNSGVFDFTCGMKMLSWKIVVR